MNEYAVFANPEFDANDYANAILAGEPYPAQVQPQTSGHAQGQQARAAKEDVSVAISKLSTGIDDVSKQIKNVVTTHHEALLEQAAGVSDLSGSLTSVRSGLGELESSLDKLRLKIRVPYQSLQTHVARLQKLQQASDLLRRTSRFVMLARRLEIQMFEMDKPEADKKPVNGTGRGMSPSPSLALENEDEKERTIAKAALSIAELVALLDGPSERVGASPDTSGASANASDKPAYDGDAGSAIPLRAINAVAVHLPLIENARTRVTTEMENMVLTGLSNLNQSLLASSLQTAYNLRVLPELVQSLVLDLSEAVEERIRTAFDMSRVSKELLAKESQSSSAQSLLYRSRIRTEPTNITAPQWTAALWARLETLIEEMAGCCIKVYTLEKVLKVKRDTVSQTVFLDEAMTLLENKPSSTFWTALARSLEKNVKDAVRGSTFLQQTLSTGYPRLLRLFHDFFAKIAVQTDTVYSQTHQSPETVLVLRALSSFEALYLSRSANKLNEAVGQAFAGAARQPPGMVEGVNIARTVANELDSAKFDPLLVQAVAKGAVGSVDMMLSRMDALIVRDRSAVTLIGPNATPQQHVNSQLATCLYHCRSRIERLDEEYPEKVVDLFKPCIASMSRVYDSIVDPLLTAIRRELAAIIARLHRIDFGKSVDPMSGMGGGGPSLYMKDLVEKLSYVKNEILSLFQVSDYSRIWVHDIVVYVIRTFVLHISIAKPLSESGKLQLTSDMTELEFALNAFMVENAQNKRGGNLESVGDDYKMLRAMRPLLFLENANLASAKHTTGLPPLIVLHHILVRSPVPLPHSLHGWQEAEYVRWVDEHSEEEAWTLVDGGLTHWEKIAEAEGTDTQDAAEYVQLARTVLTNAHNAFE